MTFEGFAKQLRQPLPKKFCLWRLRDTPSLILSSPAISKKGVWKRLFTELGENADLEYLIIASTIVRAHQHPAGAKRRKSREGDRAFARRPEHEDQLLP
jgi:hypothetical protein